MAASLLAIAITSIAYLHPSAGSPAGKPVAASWTKQDQEALQMLAYPAGCESSACAFVFESPNHWHVVARPKFANGGGGARPMPR